jgi:hypothetical protein
MILRRNDKAILEAEGEFMDVIWYDRKLVLLQNLKEGAEPIDPKIKKGVFAAMRAVEKKYGKKKLRNYYRNDFEWGMLNGKLSALRWVMGDVWDMLDNLARDAVLMQFGLAFDNSAQALSIAYFPLAQIPLIELTPERRLLLLHSAARRAATAQDLGLR